MTNAEALKFAEEMQSKLSYRLECAQNIPARSYYEKQDEMLTRAIAALREKEERANPVPLTEGQLLQMIGEPVWVMGKCYGAWVIVSGTWLSLYKEYTFYRHKPMDGGAEND